MLRTPRALRLDYQCVLRTLRALRARHPLRVWGWLRGIAKSATVVDVRHLALVLAVCGLLVGCDHRPAPPPAPPPTVALTPPAADATVAVVDAGAPGAVAVAADAAASVGDAGAGSPDAMLVVSEECLQTGVKIADVIIAATTDETQKAAIEQDRTKLVRRSAETCTRDGWSASVRGCFLASKSAAELEACGRQLGPK